MESRRVLAARKRFWINFLIGIGIYLFILFVFLEDTSIIYKVLAFAFGIGIYIFAYICGYSDGKEHIKSILDFINPELRWEIKDAEYRMYDEEDREYYESKK